MLSKKQRMAIEASRVTEICAAAVADVQERGGDIQAHSICLLRAAFELAAEIYTPAEAAIIVAKWAAEDGGKTSLINASPAGRA